MHQKYKMPEWHKVTILMIANLDHEVDEKQVYTTARALERIEEQAYHEAWLWCRGVRDHRISDITYIALSG